MTIASRDAFLQALESGDTNNNMVKVYKIIQQTPCTNQELEDIHGIPWKSGSCATTLLMDIGMIRAVMFKPDKATRGKNRKPFSIFYPIYDTEEQLKQIQERKMIVFEKWYKLGLKMGWLNHEGPYQSTIIFPD